MYGSLEKAIAGSKFWLEGNTEDDGDYEDVPGLDLIHQTGAAQYLQDVLQATVDNAGEDIIIAVQSPELDANPGFLLTPDKPQYPDSVISGGYATITPGGKQAVVLNMALFDDSFNDDDVNDDVNGYFCSTLSEALSIYDVHEQDVSVQKCISFACHIPSSCSTDDNTDIIPDSGSTSTMTKH